MKRGSFWPSPSRVTTIGARAASTPVITAALLPSERRWATRRAAMPPAASRATTAAVSSLLPSSTRMISWGVSPSAAAISGRSSARFSASFRAGTTTATFGPFRPEPCRPQAAGPTAAMYRPTSVVATRPMLSPAIVSFLATPIPACSARRRKTGSLRASTRATRQPGLARKSAAAAPSTNRMRGADGEDRGSPPDTRRKRPPDCRRSRPARSRRRSAASATGRRPRARQCRRRGHGSAAPRRARSPMPAGPGLSTRPGSRPPRRRCRGPRAQSRAA